MKKSLPAFVIGSCAFLLSVCLIFVENGNKVLAANNSAIGIAFNTTNSNYYPTWNDSTHLVQVFYPDNFTFTTPVQVDNINYAWIDSSGYFHLPFTITYRFNMSYYIRGTVDQEFVINPTFSFYDFDGNLTDINDQQDMSYRFAVSPTSTSFSWGSLGFRALNYSGGYGFRLSLNIDGIYSPSTVYDVTIPLEFVSSFTASDWFSGVTGDMNIPFEAVFSTTFSPQTPNFYMRKLAFTADSTYYSVYNALVNTDIVTGSDLSTIQQNLAWIKSILSEWAGQNGQPNDFVFSDFASAVLNYLNVISQFDIPDYSSDFSSIISYLVAISSSITSPWTYYNYNSDEEEILPSSPISTNELLMLFLCCLYGADPTDMDAFISSYFNDSLDTDFAYSGFLQYISAYFESLTPLITYLRDQFVIDSSSGYSPFMSQLETVLTDMGQSFSIDQINSTISDFRTKFYNLFKTGIVRGSFYDELETILYQVLSDFMDNYQGSGSYSDEMDDIEELESQYWEDIESNWGVITDPDFSVQSWSDISSDEPFSGEINLFMSTFTKLFNRLGSFKFVIGVVLVAGFTVVFLGKINQFGKLF